MRLIVEATKNSHGYTLQCLEYPGAITEVDEITELDNIIEAIEFVSGLNSLDFEIAVMIGGKILEFA